ncbi:MAG: helix-turn-helix domain-containing protein [Piscirickettsiaceae bacterium]|nr:helix-turn-helix domain-containing protein [Piscirickettsiaceae bacterium]
MMTDDNNDEIVVGSESPSVGEKLKAAREAKKISISEVAAQLRLMKGTIINLEAEQWEQLHGRAYARGYFLNYVKFLGLPEREMLSAFNVEYQITEAAILSHYQIKPSSRYPWLPATLLIVVLAVTWFAYQQWQDSRAYSDAADDVSPWEQLNEQQNSDDVFNASVVKPISENSETDIAIEKPASLDVTDDKEVNVEVTTEEVISLEIEQKMTKTEMLSPQQKEDADLALEQQGQIDNELAELATQQPAEDFPIIELQLSGDSWVEIKDADQQILVNRVVKENQTVTVAGKLPLSVTFGRASAVIMKYNNTVFDTSPYTEGGVARFVIEAES